MLYRAHFIAHYHFKIIMQSLVLKFNLIFNWGIFTSNTEKKINSHIWQKICEAILAQRNEYIWKAQIQILVWTTTFCLHNCLRGSLVNINVRTFPRCQLTHLRKEPYSLSVWSNSFSVKVFFSCICFDFSNSYGYFHVYFLNSAVIFLWLFLVFIQYHCYRCSKCRIFTAQSMYIRCMSVKRK